MKIKTGRGTIGLTLLLAIYSISMVTSLPGLAISPILGKMETVFKHASKLDLQMLESLPSLIIVPFILIAGRLSLIVYKKKLLIAGLAIFFACSIIYPFAKTLTLLLIISALLGIGAGMVVPFSTGLIADYFTGSHRTRQLGIASAINNLTLVLATLLSGFLAGIDWHYSFLVYCFAGISLFFAFYLDDKPPYLTDSQSKTAQSHTAGSSAGFKWPFNLMFFYYFITFVVLTIPFNLSLYMQNLHIGNPGTSGTLISVFFLAITLPGFDITRVISWFKGYTNFISLAAIAAGLILFVFKSNIFLLTIGVVLTGLGYGTMQPIIYDKTARQAANKDATYALSLVMVMNYIAIITYPFILSWITTDTAYFPFVFSLILASVFTVYAYFRKNTPVVGMPNG